MTKINATITYDPAELNYPVGIGLLVDDSPREYVASITGEYLNFIPSSDYGILPPVVKYISPAGGKYELLLLERKPQKILIDDTYEVPVPWNYFLMKVVRSNPKTIDHVSICWLFRDDQIFTPDETLSASWLTKKSFEDCEYDIEKFIDENSIQVVNNEKLRPAASIIIDAMGKCYKYFDLMEFDLNSYGAREYSIKYKIDKDQFLKQLAEKNIDDVIATNMNSEFSVDLLNNQVLRSIVDNVPTLSEKLLNESADRH